ncbi:MAG: hypothetical protein IJ733_07890, partial [Lachnospiraceae bacterium]|nr:hypothetical protein [Lachnospiraceae bacterium]
LKETGFFGYVHRFHHQTVLSFPKASRFIISLPVLYIVVFLRFIRNNRSVRNGQSIRGVIKNTNQRSRLAKKLLSKEEI